MLPSTDFMIPLMSMAFCGVGFVASVKGQASHEIVTQALQILKILIIAARSVLIRCAATAPVF